MLCHKACSFGHGRLSLTPQPFSSMALTGDQMEKIVAQVSRGQAPPGDESQEAADFRAGVTAEINQAARIAQDLGLDFQVEIPNEIPEPF